MEKEFLKYEQALALKKLGFDEPCIAFYSPKKELYPVMQQPAKGPYFNNGNFIETIRAPLYQQAFRFFREKYGLYHYILPEFYKNGINFNWQILWYLPKEKWVDYRITDGTMLYGDNGEYPTQENAELACLIKLIEIVKNKL